MSPAQRALLVLGTVSFAVVVCSSMHAGDKTANSHACPVCERSSPSLFDSDDKTCCPKRPIWCPDDYCPKCPPCICPLRYCGKCDCYDAKCLPRICPPKYCGTCDCYDAKPLPCLKIPCHFPSFYKCPPRECCVSPDKKTGCRTK